MSLALSLCGLILTPFVAYVLFGGWPAAIVVCSIYLLVILLLLGAMVYDFLRPPAGVNPANRACLGDARTNYLDKQFISRIELDIRVQLQSEKTSSSRAFHSDTIMQDFFERQSDECGWNPAPRV